MIEQNYTIGWMVTPFLFDEIWRRQERESCYNRESITKIIIKKANYKFEKDAGRGLYG